MNYINKALKKCAMVKEKKTSTIKYMVSGIEHVCKTFKNRAAGSKAESDCQKYFAKELKEWSDDVRVEPFTLHPKAFLGWIILAVICGLISVATFWLYSTINSWILPLVGVLSITFAALMFIFEFGLYRKFIDKLFPKATSHNVFATRHSKNETKRRIIFGGHSDAPYELTYSYLGGKKLVYFVMLGANCGILFLLITNIILFTMILLGGPVSISGIWLVVGIIDLLFIPFFIANLFFINWRCITDGANDNLSGCYVAMSVIRELALNDKRLDNTEVCCFLSGSEESGLRGALEFSKKHKRDLEKIETIFIAIDTLRETHQLQIYTVGQNGLQKNCEKVGQLIYKSAKSCGYDLPIAKPFPGATDAEAFSRHGLKSCGLCGVDHNIQPYYHTRCDTWTNIDAGCLEISFNVCNAAAKLYDSSNGIDDFWVK